MGLVMASRGGTVTATDINPRAQRYARLNARLNELDIEALEGDLFAPVEHRRFDLVVCQPPWVALPPAIDAVTYLHGGRRGDEVLLRLLRDLPHALTPDGIALLRFDAPVFGDDADVAARVAGVVDGLGGLLVTAPGLNADQQAVGYASVKDPTLGAGYRAAVVAYRDHLEQLGVERVVQAVALLTASAARLDHLETALLPRDPVTLSALASGQALARADAAALGGVALTTFPGTEVARTEQSGFSVTSPLGPSLRVDARVARVVEAVDSDRAALIDDPDAVREALRIGVIVPRPTG
jgi:SAM-dependent methyltransferase